MILEFSCSNHKSIKKEVVFSMMASSDKTFTERNISLGDDAVLSTSVIYGANGSGKTNFIDALAFLRKLVINSIKHEPGTGIAQIPHKLSGVGKPSRYKIQFVLNGVRYSYGFTLLNRLVDTEYLYFFPNGRKTTVFERSKQNINPGAGYKNKFKSCLDVFKPNNLLLSCAAVFSNVKEIAEAYIFIRDYIVIHNVRADERWRNYSLHQLNSNPSMKKGFMTMMRALGIDIVDIKVKIDKKKFDEPQLLSFLSDEAKSQILSSEGELISAKTIYDKFEVDLSHESTGIKKLFSFICPYIDIAAKGKTLICDELGTGLHESLVNALIEMFVKSDPKRGSQLIFSTHNSSLLNLNLFRRDQIWFTELERKNRSTDLYSLAEIKNVRKDENFKLGYFSGKYGSIPMLDKECLNQILKEED